MPEYFEFEVSLIHIKPRIWRRFLIHNQATFQKLHLAIQDACGWTNSHLYIFREGRLRGPEIAGIPDDDRYDGGPPPTPDARKIKLADYFSTTEPSAIIYEYDFGDSWEHEVTLRGCPKLPERFKRRLLAGERAFPLEDCGGTPGYEECVDAVKYRKNPDLDIKNDLYDKEDLENRLEWLGDWEPEKFDLKAVKEIFDEK